MEKGISDKRRDIPLAFRAETALKEAVADAIAAHRRAGVPIVVWRDGKVFNIPADHIEVREPTGEYRTFNDENKYSL